MALNANTFSGKQFAVYVAAEETTGTFNTTDASFSRLDVEGITIPTFSPNQEFEMRSGSSRMAEFAQIFSSSKRVMTEFTLTGRLTQEAWVILAENVISDQFDGGTGSDSVLTLSNWAGANHKVGTNPATATDYSKLMSVYFVAPTSTDSYSLKSCVCTNLQISADMNTAGGRFNYSATFQTMSAPAKGNQDGLTAAASAIGTNFLYLSQLDEKNIDIKAYATGSNQNDITPLFTTFQVTFDNPTEFLGATGTSAEPEVWARSIPELVVTWGGTVKYDTETDNLIEAFRDPDGASYLTFYLCDVAVAGSTEIPTGVYFGATSAEKFGIWFGQSKLTSAEVTSDDLAMVNFEAKVLDPASGNTLHLLGGDNV